MLTPLCPLAALVVAVRPVRRAGAASCGLGPPRQSRVVIAAAGRLRTAASGSASPCGRHQSLAAAARLVTPLSEQSRPGARPRCQRPRHGDWACQRAPQPQPTRIMLAA